MSALKLVRCLALPAFTTADTMYLVRNQVNNSLEIVIAAADGVTLVRAPTKDDIQQWISQANTGGGTEIDPRVISATGDATWSVTFDTTSDVQGTITFSETGVEAGEYAGFSVDSKGRITQARALAAQDIPALPGSKINSGLSVDTTGNAGTATQLQNARNINGVAFNGTSDITINAVDSTDRIATSEKGQPGGVAVLNSQGLVPSNQLPGFVDDVIEVTAFDQLPGESADVGTNGTPSKGKIYVVVDEILDESKTYRWSGTQYVEISKGLGVADAAIKLTTSRAIQMTGDATWTVNFDGSQDVESALALLDTGVVAGTYANLIVDSKGRVLAARALTAADIPLLTSDTVQSSASLEIVAEW